MSTKSVWAKNRPVIFMLLVFFSRECGDKNRYSTPIASLSETPPHERTDKLGAETSFKYSVVSRRIIRWILE